jgi:DNA-binding transcriptional regulator YiaG
MAVAQKKRRPKSDAPRPKPAAEGRWTPDTIRAMRVRLGLSIEQAAAKVGVTTRAFHAWELASQDRTPSPSHRILLDLLSAGKL